VQVKLILRSCYQYYLNRFLADKRDEFKVQNYRLLTEGQGYIALNSGGDLLKTEKEQNAILFSKYLLPLTVQQYFAS